MENEIDLMNAMINSSTPQSNEGNQKLVFNMIRKVLSEYLLWLDVQLNSKQSLLLDKDAHQMLARSLTLLDKRLNEQSNVNREIEWKGGVNLTVEFL